MLQIELHRVELDEVLQVEHLLRPGHPVSGEAIVANFRSALFSNLESDSTPR